MTEEKYRELVGVNFSHNPCWPFVRREEEIIARQHPGGKFSDDPLEPSEFEKEIYDQIVIRSEDTDT